MLHRSGYIMYPHISWVISPWFFSSTYHGQIAQARPSVGGEQAESEKWAVWEWVYWGPRLFQSLDFGVTYFGTNLRILLPGRFPSYFRFGIVIWFINGGKLEDQLKAHFWGTRLSFEILWHTNHEFHTSIGFIPDGHLGFQIPKPLLGG